MPTSGLTVKEQLVCQISYPVFYSGLYDSHFGINFLGANWGLIKNAQPELIHNMEGAFRELGYANKQAMVKIQAVCHDAVDDIKLQKIFKHLMILSRGGSVIASNRFIPMAQFPIKEYIELVDNVLAQIPWPDDIKNIRIEHIKMFMRTASDKGYHSVI